MSSKPTSSGSRENSSKGLLTPKKKVETPPQLKHSNSTESLLDSDVESICTSLSQHESDLIRVCIRVRPLLPSDHAPPVLVSTPSHDGAFGSGPGSHSTHSGHSSHNHSGAATPVKEEAVSIPWVYDDTAIYLPANKEVVYKYDHIFEPAATNNQIYEVMVKGVVASTMNGYHGAVFSYGQTSSGKTFTMNGNKEQTGVIPLAIHQCFSAINLFPHREFLLRISYLEVYNEQIKDLLTNDVVPIKIQFDAKINATVVTGIKEVVVSTPAQVMALLKTGEQNKHIGFTAMNEKSSRAHTIFRVFIESKDRGPRSNNGSYYSSPVKVSTLNLVDLAGSESAKMTNSKGDRAREAKHINQSLLTLSTIIQRLSEHSSTAKGTPIRKQHLPYRDSKLTRLLESSLDGNAHIAIICTISPTSHCVDETGNTLKFASRAKLIKMSAKINETVDDKTLLRSYREEIEQLKAKLQMLETSPQSTEVAANSSQRQMLPQTRSSDNLVGGAKTAVAIAAEKAAAERVEEERIMLQMISEMEKLILKADLAKVSTPGGEGVDGVAGSSGSSLVGTPATLGRTGKKRHHHTHSSDSLSEGVAALSQQLFPDTSDTGSVGGDSFQHSTTGHHHHHHRKKKEVPPLHMGTPPPPGGLSHSDGYSSGNGTFNMTLDSPKVIPLNIFKKALSPLSADSTAAAPAATAAVASGDDHAVKQVKDSSTSPIPLEEAIPVAKSTSSGSGEKQPFRIRSNGDLRVDTAQMIQTLNKEIDTIHDIIHPHSNSHSSSSSSLRGAALREGIQNTNPVSPLHSAMLKPAPRLIHTVSSVIASYTNNNHINIGSVNRQHHHHHNRASLGTLNEGANESQSSVLSERGEAGEGLTINVNNGGEYVGPGSDEMKPRDVWGRSRSISQDGTPRTGGGGGGGVRFSLAEVVDSPTLSALKKRMKSYRKSKSKVDLLLKSDSLDEYAKLAANEGVPTETNNGTSTTSSTGVALPRPSKDDVLLPIDGVRILGDDEYFSGDEEDEGYSSGSSGSYSEGEDESMILGVTKMLNYLKGYIANRGMVTKPSVYHLKGKTLSGFLDAGEAEPFDNLEGTSSKSNSVSSLLGGNVTSAAPVIDSAHYERLKLDLKLKEADNKFLQQELDNKDQMLTMLTEGLKEVEISQHQWLTTNEELSFELEKALQSNMLLKAEIARLKEQLPNVQPATSN